MFHMLKKVFLCVFVRIYLDTRNAKLQRTDKQISLGSFFSGPQELRLGQAEVRGQEPYLDLPRCGQGPFGPSPVAFLAKTIVTIFGLF